MLRAERAARWIGCLALCGLAACGSESQDVTSTPAGTPTEIPTLEDCELGEDVDWAVAEGEGYDSPEAAYEGMTSDVSLPAGELVFAEATEPSSPGRSSTTTARCWRASLPTSSEAVSGFYPTRNGVTDESTSDLDQSSR